ncbi:MAG: rhomboid family intramembrane serine protease [Salinivirgaceae bacterium]
MQGYRTPGFGGTPPVVKNLLIINALLFLATELVTGLNLIETLALYYPESSFFRPHQFITHMFMHGGLTHLFFNMFALWMFGRVLEGVWGSKRFLIYYFVTGLGASALHLFVNYLSIEDMKAAALAFQNTPSPEIFQAFVKDHLSNPSNYVLDLVNSFYDAPESGRVAAEASAVIQKIIGLNMDTPTIGASGAVFGVLLAFGMLFPNTELMLLFPPIPIKAKWLVIGYGALELFLGMTNTGSNIAHFAHLGGMIFGFILIKYWNTKGKNFY